jgi:glycosyltransferase involved in cell wall biosynthesis
MSMMRPVLSAAGVVTDGARAPAQRPRMRILMVAARCYPFMGGVEAHIHEVGQRLATRGQSVTILSTDPSGRHPGEEDMAGVKLLRVKAWPKHGDLYFAPQIIGKIAAGDWDIIHVQGYHTFVAPLAMMAAIRNGIPFVITFHSGGHSSRLRNAIRGIQHAALRPLIVRARQLVAVSQFEADFFSRRLRIARERFVVIPNGSRLPPACVRATTDGSRLVVSIGRLERYKGHHRAIRALSELLRLVPDAHLRILGEGPYKEPLCKLVRTLGLEQRVTIGGISPHDKQGIADLLCSAGLVVLLSEYEAHPVAVVEALALGRPVLVSDTSGLRELAKNGMCRSLPVSSSSRVLAAAMAEELLSARKAPDIPLPDWDSCVEALLDVYGTVLAEPDRDSPSAMPSTPVMPQV